MTGYFVNFVVYTSAMVGIIFLAVLVYKNFSVNSLSKSKFLNVEDCITLAPRKNLYVIRAGEERFLVASDAERTSLISKLDEKFEPALNTVETAKKDENVDIVDFNQAREPKKVFKNMMSKL